MSQNWESLIAERMEMHRDTYRPAAIKDATERNRRDYSRRYNARPEVKARNAERDKTPERKAQKAAWNRTEKGKASMARHNKRYVESHRVEVRAKNRRFYDKHKQDPAWMEKKRAYNRAWYATHKAERRAYDLAHVEARRAQQARFRTRHRLPSGTVYIEAHRIFLLGIGYIDTHIIREVA